MPRKGIDRYDDIGQFTWNHDLVPATKMDSLSPSAFMVDTEIVLGGAFRGSFDFGGGDLVTPPDEARPFLVRYDLTSAHIASATYDVTWGRFVGANRGPDGELALLGTFIGTLDFGDGLLKSLGKGDLFIRRAYF